MSKQTIYNILAAKAEPVKVELALRDDVVKMSKLLYDKKYEGQDIRSEIRAAAIEFNKLLVKADAATKEHQSLLNKAINLQNQMTKQLNDLGLAMKDSFDLVNLAIAIPDLEEVRDELQNDIKFYAR